MAKVSPVRPGAQLAIPRLCSLKAPLTNHSECVLRMVVFVHQPPQLDSDLLVDLLIFVFRVGPARALCRTGAQYGKKISSQVEVC